MTNHPAPKKFLSWFDPRFRTVSTWAFILNRITAIGLTIYLFLHLVMLGQLAQGQAVFDAFIALAKNPVIKFGELLVIAAGIIHGLNGIRIALNSFGIGARYQKWIFLSLMAVSLVLIAFFGYKMFSE